MDRQEVEKRLKRSGGETRREEENLVHDSSIDYKGRVPLRASTGVWKASLFIITIEFSERLSYFGIATNLITYLTQVLHQDIKTAAKNVNYWAGVTTIMPLIGGFLADAYTGRFNMVMFASLVYLMGLSLLTMSQFIPSLKPCKTEICRQPRKLHEVLLFVALYFISVGTGGHKPCLQSFGADQFDDDHLEERKKKMSFFNWWNFALCCGLFLGVTVIVYVQDSVSWGVADLVLTITLAITIVTFYMGKYCYRYRVAHGSPLIPMLQVLVAAIRKRNLPNPQNPDLLFEVPKSEKYSHGRLLLHTNRLRFLDKAAIIDREENENYQSCEQKHNPWRLATLTRVEELKLILNMIPIWLTLLPNTVCLAQASTFFVKQAATMNRNITNDFKIPPASIFSLGAIAMLVSVMVYDKVLVPMLRKATGNERGMNILHRIGVGMILVVIAMAVTALVERKRLQYADPQAMSVFWLAPQYIILGIGDAFALVGLQEYFYDQVPDSMRSLGVALYLSVIGVGSFLSSFLISVLDHVTAKYGRSWFGKDLSGSRLDNFFWLLAALNGLNLCVYGYFARGYTYKNVDRRVALGDHSVRNGNDQSIA
ncbi:PREDICTED: putative peptide/nitrate transporter At2g37900-like [Fragaria vesca subsp. vesca]|uniref:protein NRT1/ PTR FAMILY 5.6-like n=1 Tax=Fragaria vesca subsp. vesca TaxID=101020 RepID=UPI0002C34F53|nr:PREDICTED: protein NRT1/ PTR FAMILY 5.6-like [Fragaria vesca subsp. vesca]